MKAFLSSPAALEESITGRLKLDKPKEQDKLERLKELNSKVTEENSNKFAALIDYLMDIGVKKGSDRRVVIFSERVATLQWLQENVSKHLKLPKGAVKVMHGGLSDSDQLALIDEFKRTDTPLRVLITGDVASEGVNLHAQCHHLVHYDIPWSLIRIQQRNGRIDRYGQEHEPEITSLLLDPKDAEVADAIGELRVLTRLIDREYSANQLLGDAAPLMGKHNPKAEEDEIRAVLMHDRDFDEVVASPRTCLPVRMRSPRLPMPPPPTPPPPDSAMTFGRCSPQRQPTPPTTPQTMPQPTKTPRLRPNAGPSATACTGPKRITSRMPCRRPSRMRLRCR